MNHTAYVSDRQVLVLRRNETMQPKCARLARTISIICLLLIVYCQPGAAFFFTWKETTEEDVGVNNDNDGGSGNTTMTNQCTGLTLDSSRLVLVVDDNEEVLERIKTMSQQSAPASKPRRGNNKDGLAIIQQRDVDLSSSQQYSRSSDSSDNFNDYYSHSDGSISSIRLQATYRGIKVHGADIVVTTVTTESAGSDQHPANSTNTSDPQHPCTRNQTTTRIHGKMFQNISLSSDQIALSSSLLLAPQELPTGAKAASAAALHEARRAISAHFGVPIQHVGGDVSLEIYPTPLGDYLAFFGDVMVAQSQPTGTGTQLFEVVVDAMSMTILRKCLVGGFNDRVTSHSQLPSSTTTTPVGHRNLRPNRIVDRAPPVTTITGETNNITMVCGTCPESSHNGVLWSTDDDPNGRTCYLQSLYLNNTEKLVPCVSGVDREGIQVFGPGPIHSLFWRGTYDCHSSSNTDLCDLVPFSEGCIDAMNDVQFVATKTMQFLEDHLGVLTGDFLIRNPKPIRAFVHYDTQYCNALFRGREDTLYFGDCDCQRAGAMVSLDIIAHEISHFLTWHSSHLASGYESGGLSEGYGDILGTMMEFVIDDNFDRPDFTIGESTGIVMRSMEDPSSSFGGLESVCHYDVRNSTPVHATSGPLNKAFVLSVRACQEGSCAASTTECVILLGSIFQYSNLHKLSMYSGYLDAATASCESVNDFFLERAPNTTCSVTDTYSYIKHGWDGVNVVFEGSMDQCRARKQCQGGDSQSLGTRAFLTLTGILDRVVQMKRSVLHFRQ